MSLLLLKAVLGVFFQKISAVSFPPKCVRELSQVDCGVFVTHLFLWWGNLRQLGGHEEAELEFEKLRPHKQKDAAYGLPTGRFGLKGMDPTLNTGVHLSLHCW